ncbi:MAG: glutathione synthase, partial [Pseudomonadota bacterium]|nr:glutathione synthase [Pseudomonadota bacterium]
MKPIRLGVLMDDISNIKPNKDSSFAMMLEAQKRGWEIHTFDSPDMFYADGQVNAHSKRTSVKDSDVNWYTTEGPKVINLGSLDVVFMRKDPPFDMDYIYATYLLEQLESEGVLVVNKPSSLRDANEKLFALNFPD